MDVPLEIIYHKGSKMNSSYGMAVTTVSVDAENGVEINREISTEVATLNWLIESRIANLFKACYTNSMFRANNLYRELKTLTTFLEDIDTMVCTHVSNKVHLADFPLLIKATTGDIMKSESLRSDFQSAELFELLDFNARLFDSTGYAFNPMILLMPWFGSKKSQMI